MDKNDIPALRTMADLMDEDDARTNKVGIPVSYGHYLIFLAVTKPYGDFDIEWARLAKTQSRQAANAWADKIDAQHRRLIELIYPGGAVARAKTAQEIRAMADEAETTV